MEHVKFLNCLKLDTCTVVLNSDINQALLNVVEQWKKIKHFDYLMESLQEITVCKYSIKPAFGIRYFSLFKHMAAVRVCVVIS